MARKKIEENYDETKQRFIYAAMNELMESGYSRFTLTSVAQNAGVTKAALYWYFPSKEKLIEEVADTVYSFNVKKVQLIATSSLDPLEKLRTIFVPEPQLENDKMCIIPIKIYMELLSGTNELKRKIQSGYEEYINWIAKIVQEGMETGVFYNHWTSQALAKYIVSLFDGAAIQGLIFTQDISGIYKLFFEMMLTVLKNNV